MPALIPAAIGSQNFEVVRDQIGAILAVELESQAGLTYETELEVTVWLERFIPIDKSECPAVIVSFSTDDFSTEHVGNSDGMTRFFIDCYTAAKSGDGVRGDQLSRFNLHRLLGVIRAILMDSRYKTLGIAAPSISNRRVESIAIKGFDGDSKDAISTSMGRIVLAVRVPESVELLTAPLLAGNTTEVRLEETDLGFQYVLTV